MPDKKGNYAYLLDMDYETFLEVIKYYMELDPEVEKLYIPRVGAFVTEEGERFTTEVYDCDFYIKNDKDMVRKIAVIHFNFIARGENGKTIVDWNMTISSGEKLKNIASHRFFNTCASLPRDIFDTEGGGE